MFQSGRKSESELGELRRRKGGKQLERFHREQNEVRRKLLFSAFHSFKINLLVYASISS